MVRVLRLKLRWEDGNLLLFKIKNTASSHRVYEISDSYLIVPYITPCSAYLFNAHKS